MRQLIIAAVTLIVLTAASSALALRSQSQSQPVTHCSALVANPPCPGARIPLQLGLPITSGCSDCLFAAMHKPDLAGLRHAGRAGPCPQWEVDWTHRERCLWAGFDPN